MTSQATQLSVYNMALMRIGVFNSLLTDVNEQIKEALVCSAFYPIVLDYVLRDFPWNFAETRVPLAALGTQPQNWLYNYELPPDYIKALYITYPGLRRMRYDQQPSWQIANLGGQNYNGGGTSYGLQLLTDFPPPMELCYTARVTDLTKWDVMAVSALGYRLAAEIAMPMKASTNVAANAMKGYEQECQRAAAHMMNEQILDPEPPSGVLAVRGTGGMMTGMYPNGYPIWPNGSPE